jgi:hypothetical protein
MRHEAVDEWRCVCREGKPDMFTFTQDGRMKFWEQGDERGMVLAESRTLAQEFARWLRDQKGVTVDLTEIGRAKGATLKQLNLSLKHGANCAFVVRAIAGDKVEFDMLVPPR